MQKAEKMAKRILDYVKILFRKVEDGMLTREQVHALVDEYVAILLERHEDGLVMKGLNGIEWTESHAVNMQSQYISVAAELQKCLMTNELLPATQFISWLSEEKKYEPENELEKARLGREFLKGCIQAFKICWLRVGGTYDSEFDGRPLTSSNSSSPRTASQTTTGNTPVQGSVPQDNDNMLGKRIDEYYKERSTSGRWRISMKNAVHSYLSLLKEHFGADKCLQDITRPQMIDYRERILRKLPVRRHHDKSTKNLPLSELLMRRNVQTISIKTINEYIGNVSSFLAWCYDNNYVAFNVAKGLAIKAKLTEREQKPRYENGEIKRLLGILASSRKKGVMGLKNKDRKWIILLAIYQGMRQNEVCQLKVNDIKIYQTIILELSRRKLSQAGYFQTGTRKNLSKASGIALLLKSQTMKKSVLLRAFLRDTN
ncbi:MAG: hypothetical protein NT118_02410 [Lentisphaerae bacterium]|nr:hypothetical protein [Lentisphaerota bacterium]